MHTEESGLNLRTEAFMPIIDPVYVLGSLNYSSIVEACSFEWVRVLSCKCGNRFLSVTKKEEQETDLFPQATVTWTTNPGTVLV